MYKRQLQDQADILNDYEEHFRIGLENGKTEAEIAGSLGSPEELGASFVEENAQPCLLYTSRCV